MELFWETEDRENLDAVWAQLKAIEDPKLLEKIVRNAPLEEVRLAALQNITDKKLLMRIGKTGKGPAVRAAAYERAGQPFLAKVEWLKGHRHYEGWVPLWDELAGDLTDPKVLRDIIDNARADEVRELAVKKIEDPAVLENLAKNHGRWRVRRAALEALGQEQTALEESAIHERNYTARKSAIEQLENRELLKKLCENEQEQDLQIRRAVKRRLHFLQTGEADYMFDVGGRTAPLQQEPEYDDVAYGDDDEYTAVKKNGKTGFADRTGRLVIPCEYDGEESLHEISYHFYEDVASVQKNGLWGVIDRQGNIRVPFEYNWRLVFEDGLAAACKDGLWGYIDQKGAVVIALQYDDAEPFSESKALVYKDEKEYAIDKEGRILFELEGCTAYYSAGFRGGYLGVARSVDTEDGRQKQLFGLLDSQGKVAVPLEYDELTNYFAEDVRPAEKEDLYGLVANDGRIVAPFEYDRVWSFDEDDIALARRDDLYGFLDKEGRVVISFRYQDMYYPEEGAIPAKLDDKWGLINLKGEPIIPFEYERIDIFYKKRAVVEKNGKCGCIDPEGNVVVPLVYDEVEGFEVTDFTMVCVDGKYGCVGQNNEPLIPIRFDDVCWPLEGIAIVQDGCDWIIVDKQGQTVYPYAIDNYRPVDSRHCWIEVHGKWGMLLSPGLE